MKRNLGLAGLLTIAGLVSFIVCIYPQSGYASPPESVQIKYIMNAQTLSVTIAHDSMMKGSHYIKFVEIKKNGVVISINSYDAQPTGNNFTYTYKIPAVDEDTFQVVASCNLWGSKTSSLLTIQVKP